MTCSLSCATPQSNWQNQIAINEQKAIFQQCNCPYSTCSQRTAAHSCYNACTIPSLCTSPSIECCHVYFGIASKDPHLLWIVAPLRKTVKAVGLRGTVDCRIRTVPGYLWLRGLTWLQAGRDCQKWYRKDICPGDIVVRPHHCHLQLAFYSPWSCCCKWQLAETIFGNESPDYKGLNGRGSAWGEQENAQQSVC